MVYVSMTICLWVPRGFTLHDLRHMHTTVLPYTWLDRAKTDNSNHFKVAAFTLCVYIQGRGFTRLEITCTWQFFLFVSPQSYIFPVCFN